MLAALGPLWWCFSLVVLGGLSSGAASMWLYKLASPQAALDELRRKLRESQQTLKCYDGDFDGMRGLLRENLSLSLTRVRYSFGPSLLAGIPVIAVLSLLGATRVAEYQYFAVGPAWIGSWLTLFFVTVTLTAVAVKVAFRIQ